MRVQFLALTITAAALTAPMSAQAADFDMDCKVILCMAGGFPSECQDAYSYMIRRITRFPRPLPPFGHCEMSDGTNYSNYTTNAGYLHDHWECAPPSKLRVRTWDDDGRTRYDAFCYDHATTRRWEHHEDGWRSETTYHGKRSATEVDYHVQITIEPGTPQAYTSADYRISFGTGQVFSH